MADKEGTRKTSAAILVCSAPDVCKTPCGPSVVPVPYQIISLCSCATGEVTSVCMTGIPTLNLGSKLTTVIGDEPGVAGGVKSGVNKSICEFIKGSSTVNAGGKSVIRHDDPAMMNNGNTIGKIVYPLASSTSTPEAEGAQKPHIDKNGKPAGNTEGSLAPETPKEKGFLHQVGGFFVGGAEALWEMGKGLYSLVQTTDRLTSPSEWISNGEGNLQTVKNIDQGFSNVVQNPGSLVDAIVKPYEEAIATREYGEAIGRGLIDVGSFFVGAGEAGMAGKAGEVAGAAGKIGEFAKVGEAGELGKVGETAQIGKEGDDFAKVKELAVPEGQGAAGGGGGDGLTVTSTPKSVGHRREHILNRHRAGSSKPGKTEFPSNWTDDDIVRNVESVANDPLSMSMDNKYGSSVMGYRDGVAIQVDLYPANHPKYSGRISTAYPVSGPINP